MSGGCRLLQSRGNEHPSAPAAGVLHAAGVSRTEAFPFPSYILVLVPPRGLPKFQPTVRSAVNNTPCIHETVAT